MNIIRKNTKFILGFILGGLILGSISVYAALNYQASQIVYGNTTLDQALDNLYSTASALSYTPSGHIIPSASIQTLKTENKRVTSDIIIDPIPSVYKDINDATNFSASDLVSGAKAYNKSGQLITGSANLNCINGSFVHNANTQLSYNFSFAPSSFILSFNQTNDRFYHIIYNGGISNQVYAVYGTKDGYVLGLAPGESSSSPIASNNQSPYHIDGKHVYSTNESGYAYSNTYIVYYTICH